MRRGRARECAGAGLLGLAALAWAAGCAADLLREGAGYRHRRLGYAIAAPGGAEGYWRRVKVQGADLAYRGAQGESMSLAARCGRREAAPRILARHLRIGLPEHRMRASGPVAVGDRDGWMQIFDTRASQGTVRVKTVTAVAGGCIYDWVLVARESFEAAEPSFDAWWASFRGPAPAASGLAP